MSTDWRRATTADAEAEVSAFVGARCDRTGRSSAQDLYADYRVWATGEMGNVPISDRLFGTALTNLGFGKARDERLTYRTGICLRVGATPQVASKGAARQVRLIDSSGNAIAEPEGLATHSLLIWKHGLDVGITDAARLALLYKGCRMLEQANAAADQLEVTGFTQVNARGEEIEHPMVQIAARLSRQASSCFSELGLNMPPLED